MTSPRRMAALVGALAIAPTCPARSDLRQPEAATPAQPAVPSERSIAEEPRIHLRVGAWFTGLDGNITVGDPIPGALSDIDLLDTLNLDPDQIAIVGSVTFDLGAEQRWHISLGYSGQFKYDGTSDPVNISFNNLNFTGVVDSDATFSVYEIGVMRDLARPGPVTIALGMGTRIFDFEGSVTGTATDPNTGITQVQSSSADALAPIPGLAAVLRWDITEQVYIRGSAQGIYLGNYGSFFDAAAELGFDFTENIGLFGGYRWMRAEADVSDVDFDINLKGFFGGVEVRF